MRRPFLVWVAAALLPVSTAAVQAPPALEQVLQIGLVDGPEAYTFGNIAGVRLLSHDQFLVLDQMASRVHVYDLDGRHLRSFGSKGTGPGEFERAQSVAVTADGVRIFDSRLQRWSLFTPDGQHIETARIPNAAGSVASPALLRHGRWIGEHPASISSEHIRAVVAGDERAGGTGMGRVIVFDEIRADTLMSYEGGTIYWYGAETGVPFGGMARPNLGSGGLWAVAGDSLVAFVDARRGRIGWLKVDGTNPAGAALGGLISVRNVDLGLTPVPVGGREHREMERRLRADFDAALPSKIGLILPSAAAHFTRLLLDDEGSVWLERRRGLTDTADPYAARFTIVRLRDGNVREMTLPPGFQLSAVTGGMLLGWTRTELDVPVVQLYRLR